MSINTEGKLRILLELRHNNDEVSVGFVYVDDQKDILNIFSGAGNFVIFELLNGEIIFIASSDVKAFKISPTDKNELYHIWCFDPYIVLGVKSDISSQELQERYFALLQQTHPDVIDTNALHPAFKISATDMTRRIMSAFEFIRAELSLTYHDR